MKPFSKSTGPRLSADLVDRLQDLIETNIDSSNNLNDAAEHIKDDAIAQLFRDIARQRSLFAEELKRFVRDSGEDPKKDGTLRGAAHRAWLDIRAAINAGNPYVVLIEVEREEDRIKHAYNDLLDRVTGSPAGESIQRQFQSIQQQHNAVKSLRDAYKVGE
jgi:uncharacterized protein (TIGR02284 family)